MSDNFTAEELEILRQNERPRQRWLGDSNLEPLIADLMERRLMQPAYGEFGAPRDRGEKLVLLGHELPVVEFVSLYCLTPRGRHLYSVAEETSALHSGSGVITGER